jgi:hypothetical protein
MVGDAMLKEIACPQSDFSWHDPTLDWSLRETLNAKKRGQIKDMLKHKNTRTTSTPILWIV